MITISKKEYYELKCADAKLTMLECGGVDNWSWYSESLYPDGEKDYNEVCEELRKEILG